jgi:hypothetical protein
MLDEEKKKPKRENEKNGENPCHTEKQRPGPHQTARVFG